MPGENGAGEAPKSFREIAEAAWDEVVETPEPGSETGTEPADEPIIGQDGQPRDKQGRFVAKTPEGEPGEHSGTQPEPAPNAQQPPPAQQPAQQGTEAPQHWPAQVREMFSRQPQEVKDFLLERHKEMEADYTRKTQAAATAVQFTNALAPIFQDPVIAGDMQRAGASPYEAIQQWASYHRRAMDPDMRVRQALHAELGQRMGLVPQPAGNGQMSPQGLSEEDLKDPAIKFFADHIGKTSTAVETLGNRLAEMQHQEDVRRARWQVDQFADAKDQQGNPLHPHFHEVSPLMSQMFAANPQLDMTKAYEDACWQHPEVRQKLIDGQIAAKRRAEDNARAKQAARSNVRGVTTPVTAPKSDKPMGLRGTIEASADEVGLN